MRGGEDVNDDYTMLIIIYMLLGGGVSVGENKSR